MKIFPPLTAEYEKQASTLLVAFKGDPSFFAYTGSEEPDSDDPEVPKIERFREIHRVVYTVNVSINVCIYTKIYILTSHMFLPQSIENDCAIVPRGAYIVDATKKVIANAYYQGVGFDSASSLRGFLHFRNPQREQGKVMLKKPGLIKSGEFMDCIDKDGPAGMISYISLCMSVYICI